MEETQLENDKSHDVFIYCGGKCGSCTLCKTFNCNNYNAIHIHNNQYYQIFFKKQDTIFNQIDLSCKKVENVYIIDSYRTPIERKISCFFQIIDIVLPNWRNLQVEELISVFNAKYVNVIEEYKSLNEVLEYYKVPLFTKFDFNKKYNIVQKDNKIFIKILFKDIDKWDAILSEIFNKPITIHSDNLTECKPMNHIYNEFKEKYKVPKTYIHNVLNRDAEFAIYNTKDEQKKYKKKWLKRSC